MYYVTWKDAKEFIKKLNELNDGYEYSLPSEAQWEYAARAGTADDYAGLLEDLAWYANNSGIAYQNSDLEWVKVNGDVAKYNENFVIPNKNGAHAVGTKKPNAFGLYDMHGNVWEWCEDLYSFSYQGLPDDGSPNEVQKDSEARVMRGGSWKDTYPSAEFQRSAYRMNYLPHIFDISIGFRVAARRK